MRPVSQELLRALRGSHGMAARARVCTTYQNGVDPAGDEIPILGGDVRLDADNPIRSTLDLTTDGTGMWPSRAGTALAPYGNEIYVERGVRFGGGAVEWVSLGYFRIDAIEQDVPPDGPIRLTGSDRMAGLVDGRVTAPRQYLAGATYGAVVDDLVLDIYPDATIEWDDSTSSATLGRALVCEEDRHAFLDDLVTSRGKIWYWDYRGVLVVRTPPDEGTVWDVTQGRDGVLVSMSRELSREGAFNGVVASGEAADTTAPVRAVAVDANPASPTVWGGRFGKVPRFFTSPFLLTDDQARQAAETLLRRGLGHPYEVEFGAVPNPALEPWDAVRVSYSDRSPTERHVIRTLTVPLAADQPMSAATREQLVTIVGSVP